jgi:hypothetical protein
VTTDGVNAMFVSALWSADRLALAWTDNRDTTMDVYFARAGVDGSLDGSLTRISDAAGNSYNPSVATNGDRYFVAWADTMGREIWEFRIFLSVLDSAGAVISGPTLVSADEWDAKMPVMAWSAGVLAMCWEDYRDGGHDVFCAAFDADGAPVTAAAAVASLAGNTMSAILSPSLVPTADGFALAWADEDGTPGDSEVYFALLSSTLAVTAGDTPLTDTAGALSSVDLVGSGPGFGVAYVQEDGAAEGEDTVHYLPFMYCE